VKKQHLIKAKSGVKHIFFERRGEGSPPHSKKISLEFLVFFIEWLITYRFKEIKIFH
jgi:hypothetical protein